jgi:hypothetical protein
MNFEPINDLAGLRIEIFGDRISASGFESLNLPGQFQDMAFGPFDL